MRNRQRTILTSIILAAIVAAGAGAYLWHSHRNNTPTATRGATGTGGAKTATGLTQPPSSAPTTEPTVAPTAAPSAASKSSVKPVISTLPYISGGQLHVRAYADGGGGARCSLTLTHTGSSAITVSAEANGQGICQGFDVAASGLAKGSWSARVTIASATIEGTSDDAVFTVN